MYESWKLLWPFVKPYKLKVITAMTLGFMLSLLAVVQPFLIQVLIYGFQKKTLVDDPNFLRLFEFFDLSKDHLFYTINHKEMAKYAALALPAYFLVYGIIRYYHFFLVKFSGEEIISDMRVALMDKFMNLDVLYLGRQQKGSGGMLSRTLNDTVVLQQGLQFYADLLREPITGVFLIGYMLFINWKITLACFVFLPLFAGVIRYITKSLKFFGHESQESLEEVTRTLKEGMDGVRVIQSFNLQGMMQTKFRRQVSHYLSKRRKIIKREELGSPINEWFASILVCGICLVQAQLIWGNESDVSGFIAFLFAAGMLDKPVKKTQQALIRVQQNVVALERMDEILSSPTQVKESTQPTPFPNNWQGIHFKNVSFSYKDKQVLHDINLDLKKGEVVALVGESGSGKSTLAGLLQRFFDPQNGEILIGDVRVQDISTQALRSNIGYVTQDVFLFDDTIENNIWFGQQERTKSDVPGAAQMANATKFIEETDGALQARVGERGGRLSGGEKQRISIARAVFKDPPLLILDEATSALDSASEQEVQKGIETLLKGRTALVIAHRLSTIINSDRIVVMKEGRVVEQGTHQELLDKDQEYARFYKLQYAPE